MSEELPTSDDIRSAWDALAGFWDERVEAGETWQRHLIQPAVERLLELQRGERVLEIACGNGEFARRMAELGASVLATDFSEPMLDRARAHGGEVEYRLVDATDEAQLLALGDEGSFDAVVSNMAIMDMSSIEPMVSASARLLRPGGRFVFSTLHPAFNSGDAVPTTELVYSYGDVRKAYSVKVSGYGQALTGKGVAIPGQSVAQWYFHGPLAEILRAFFEHALRARRARGAPRRSRARHARLPGVRVHRDPRRAGRADASVGVASRPSAIQGTECGGVSGTRSARRFRARVSEMSAWGVQVSGSTCGEGARPPHLYSQHGADGAR